MHHVRCMASPELNVVEGASIQYSNFCNEG